MRTGAWKHALVGTIGIACLVPLAETPQVLWVGLFIVALLWLMVMVIDMVSQ